MQPWPENEDAGLALETPAGEGARGLLHVLLGIPSFTEREKFHRLAREIFVRCAFPVLHAVEIEDHRRVPGNGMQERAEVANGVFAQRHILAVHETRDPDLRLRRDEMVVPEQRHALGKRRWRGQHFLHPPGAKLQGLAQLPLLERLAIRFGKNFAAGRPQRRFIERRRRGRGDDGRARFAQQLGDRFGASERSVGADFALRWPEAGAGEQMARVGIAQNRIRRGERRQARAGGGQEKNAEDNRADHSCRPMDLLPSTTRQGTRLLTRRLSQHVTRVCAEAGQPPPVHLQGYCAAAELDDAA